MKIREIAKVSFKLFLGYEIGKRGAYFILDVIESAGSTLAKRGRAKLEEAIAPHCDPGETPKEKIRKIFMGENAIENKKVIGFH